MKSISATRYSTFETCPRQYEFRYHFNLMSQKNEAMEIGSLYHAMLEKYYLESESSARELIKGKHHKILSHLFSKYLGNPIFGKVVETEYRFRLDVPNVKIPLYGFIDRIDEDKGVEYKSTSKKWKDKDVNTIQTDIYLYVLLKKFGKSVPLIYSINNKKTNVPPQIIPVERSEEEIMGLEGKIFKFIEDVKTSTFEPTPGPHCFGCPWGSKGDNTCQEYGQL